MHLGPAQGGAIGRTWSWFAAAVVMASPPLVSRTSNIGTARHCIGSILRSALPQACSTVTSIFLSAPLLSASQHCNAANRVGEKVELAALVAKMKAALLERVDPAGADVMLGAQRNRQKIGGAVARSCSEFQVVHDRRGGAKS